MHWTLKRSDNQETLQLHPQFAWADEYDWTPLAQSEPVYTLTGSMDIQQGTKKAGRPITLNGDNAYVTRATLEMLQTWATMPELELTLTHPKGQTYNVIFKRPAVSNIRVLGMDYMPADRGDDDKLHCNIGLLTI